MRTVEKTIYRLDELDERAQEQAIERLYDLNVDDDWWEFIYEDAERVAEILGIDLNQKAVRLMGGGTRYDPEIWFTGTDGNSGSSYRAYYKYSKGSRRAIREYAPQDEELHAIADKLLDAQKRNFFQLTASVVPGHREEYIRVDVDRKDGKDMTEDATDIVTEALEDFNNWIFCQLRDEYEYKTSRDAIRETILANDYEFDEDGNLA